MNLQEKIEKLKADSAEKLEKDIKCLELKDTYKGCRSVVAHRDGEYAVYFDVDDLQELRRILNFEANYPLFTDWKGKKELGHYRVGTDSPVRGAVNFEISFKPEKDLKISVKFEPHILGESFDKWAYIDTRKVTSSETHYFGGVSYTGIDKMKIPCIRFKAASYSFYGGREVLRSGDGFIESIREC